MMLTNTLQAKLIDFGLSSTATTLATSSQRARFAHGHGTIGYMAPEKLTGDASKCASPLSHKVDVYAYGVVL